MHPMQLVFILLVLLVGAFCFLKGLEKLNARRGYIRVHHAADEILSSYDDTDDLENESVDAGVVSVHRITLTNTPHPAGVSVEPANTLTTQTRDIIKFEAKVDALASLYDAGLITNLGRSVEKAFKCSKQSESKPESTYQQAYQAIKARSKRWQQENVGPEIFKNGERVPMDHPVSRRYEVDEVAA